MPKKVVYHEYITTPPTVSRKVSQPHHKKYEFKQKTYSKYPKVKLEYKLPISYESKEYHHQDEYYTTPEEYKTPQIETKPHQNFQHYTVYRGNNDSSEETQTVDERMDKEVPYDIHVYHK